MRTGLFGGAFDPFHNGHMAICAAAAASAGLDRLIVIPTGRAPHKESFGADFKDRYAMTVAALEGMGIEVSRWEGDRDEVSYSADTVEHFRRELGRDELFFIVGADSYRDMDKWYQPWRITASARLAVFPRGGVDIKVRPPAIAVNMEKVDVSSTMIRELIRRGGDPSPYLPAAVWRYITKYNLYK